MFLSKAWKLQISVSGCHAVIMLLDMLVRDFHNASVNYCLTCKSVTFQQWNSCFGTTLKLKEKVFRKKITAPVFLVIEFLF